MLNTVFKDARLTSLKFAYELQSFGIHALYGRCWYMMPDEEPWEEELKEHIQSTRWKEDMEKYHVSHGRCKAEQSDELLTMG